MFRRYTLGLCAGLIFLAGCLYPVREKVEGVVCDLSALPRDLQPAEYVHPAAPAAPAEGKPGKSDSPEKKGNPGEGVEPAALQAKKGEDDKDDLPRARPRLRIPDELMPGGPVPPIKLPPPTPETEEARKKAIEQLY